MVKKRFSFSSAVTLWFVSASSKNIVIAAKDFEEEDNTRKTLPQLFHREWKVGSNTHSVLTNHPPHVFFEERKLAQACSSHEKDCFPEVESSYYNRCKARTPSSTAFVGMQLHVFRHDPNRQQQCKTTKNHELPATSAKNNHKIQELPAASSSTTDSETKIQQKQLHEQTNNNNVIEELHFDSFGYEKSYQLVESLNLELGVPPKHHLDYAYTPPKHHLDYAYTPVLPQDSEPQELVQPEQREHDEEDSKATDRASVELKESACTDLAEEENIFSNWWKWWLPYNKAHGSRRSDYKMGKSAFAGGSHGEVWRGRRLCNRKEPRSSSMNQEEMLCDDRQPLILKRLRVEQGYRLLEAGLREIYVGNWIQHELSQAQQSLYTKYVDHFFREIPVPRTFGRYQNSQLELWVVFEDAGPSLRSYIYKPVSSPGGGFVMYQPSRLWSQLRSSNMEERRSDEEDSSISVSRRDPTNYRHQQESTGGDDTKRAKNQNYGREIMRTVLWQIVSAAALMHDNGMVHRDIKPSNVMCTSDVELEYLESLETMPQIQCKLGDFSSVWDDNYLSVNLYTNGPSPAEQTDEYAPPESYIGENWVPFDRDIPQSYDSWSIGVLALELLLGTPNVFSNDQRTTALLTNKMKKENASDEEVQRALYLAALSHFCIYMPSNNSTKQQSWPLRDGDPLHKTAMAQKSCTLHDFHRALRARDPLGIGFDSSADLLLHLIWQLLAWDPLDRMTAAEALQHPYFTSPDGTNQFFQWKIMPSRHDNMAFQISDPRFDLSSADDVVDEFTCPKCRRVFSDWRSCHMHANFRKHGKFCSYDRTSLPTCINTHSMLPAHPTSGYCDLQGRRSVIEDFHSIHLHPTVQFYGIFDGHTGNLASKYVASTMYKQLVRRLNGLTDILDLPSWKEQVTQNVSLAFQEIHEGFLQQAISLAPSAMDQSGTTATALIVTEEAVVIASIGDSRAVLSSTNADGSMSALQLTKDHVASDPHERDLVIQRGGSISSSGGIDRVNGTLAITRSIGDGNLAPLLSRLPHVVSMTRDEIREQCGENRKTPCFIVLASDGLWDVMTNQEAVDMVAQVMTSYDATDRVSWNNGGAFQEASEVLAIDAYVRGSNDNIGVCVVAVE